MQSWFTYVWLLFSMNYEDVSKRFLRNVIICIRELDATVLVRIGQSALARKAKHFVLSSRKAELNDVQYDLWFWTTFNTIYDSERRSIRYMILNDVQYDLWFPWTTDRVTSIQLQSYGCNEQKQRMSCCFFVRNIRLPFDFAAFPLSLVFLSGRPRQCRYGWELVKQTCFRDSDQPGLRYLWILHDRSINNLIWR
jgi:hypothetical protein